MIRLHRYRITYNDGTTQEAMAIDAYSLVQFLGGSLIMLQTISKIEVRNVVSGEYVNTGILDWSVHSPTARWVTADERESEGYDG